LSGDTGKQKYSTSNIACGWKTLVAFYQPLVGWRSEGEQSWFSGKKMFSEDAIGIRATREGFHPNWTAVI